MKNEERAATGEEIGRGGNKAKREKTEIDGGKRKKDGIWLRDYVFWDWIII